MNHTFIDLLLSTQFLDWIIIPLLIWNLRVGYRTLKAVNYKINRAQADVHLKEVSRLIKDNFPNLEGKS